MTDHSRVVRGVAEQSLEFVATQDHRQLARLPQRRDRERRAVALEGRVIEEPEPVHHNVARARRALQVANQMDQVRLDLCVGNLVRRSSVEPGEPGDRPQIRFTRPIRNPGASMSSSIRGRNSVITHLRWDERHHERSSAGFCR